MAKAKNYRFATREREHVTRNASKPLDFCLLIIALVATLVWSWLDRMPSMTADSMLDTEIFYAPDACERVVALFRSFVAPE